MERRTFIKKSAIGIVAGSALLESCMKVEPVPVSMASDNFSNLLGFPKVIQNPQDYVMTAKSTLAKVNNNGMTEMLSYMENMSTGPLFKMQKGHDFSLLFKNNLDEHTNIHWHGLLIPAKMDGHPNDVVHANESFNYRFTVNQRAGAYWYHPHPHEATARQTYMGLAGMIIVNDAEEAALKLPSGELELPLIISDKRLTNNALLYNPTTNEVMSGYMGETITVNGIAFPFTEITNTTYRLRILNASNARIYNLAFSNNLPFTVIGSDGGLLENSVKVTSLLLCPAERIDILVDFGKLSLGDVAFLKSNTFPNGSKAQGQEEFSLMKFIVKKTVSENYTIPARLSTIERLAISSKTRNFKLQMKMGLRMTHRINNKLYESNRIDETVKAGDTETWIFNNSSDEPHPMHIHGVQFQISERSGNRGILPHEKGWKDVVLLLPNEIVKVTMKFPDNKGKYMVHCHNLEHEDDGMMLQFEIV
ncbi:multicopper oxidase family protein [Emticicia sp.]|uniref:multicopper oxidase family protein n=1 Tax=Emticicia sp. TaxID=1930953 RepID=UPI003752A23B